MKTVFTLFAFTLFFGAFAQEEKTSVLDKPECILWPLEVKPIPMVFDVDEFYRRQVKQPYGLISSLPCGNISKEAKEAYWNRMNSRTGPLNKESPFLHTLTGAVFTFDYIRYSVR